MALLVGFLVLMLVAVTAIRPRRSQLSDFELRRRIDEKDETARQAWRQTDLFVYVRVLQKSIETILLVIVSALSVWLWSWTVGLLIALAIGLLYKRLANIGFITNFVQRFYVKKEAHVLNSAESLSGILKKFVVARDPQELACASRQEFEHVISENSHLVSDNEKKVLQGALRYERQLVKDHMVPRGTMHSVSAEELLGPLALDDLYKSGHHNFPVRDGDIDHIVGILHVQDLLSVKTKKSSTAKDVMDGTVYYIHEDQTLARALEAFIKTKRHLFIVINQYRETVGLITTEDVMEVLLGQKIVDQFDRHDDLRSVAKRNIAHHNTPPHHVDV